MNDHQNDADRDAGRIVRRRPRLEPVRNIDIRRAIFAVLLSARRPVTIDEILYELEHEHRIAVDAGRSSSARQKISDVLRYQARQGRVRRVARGTYSVVPGAISPSSRWRCLNWRGLRDRSWYTV